jgi:Chemotaxis phosphatase CheX
MSLVEEFEAAREDLEGLLAECLATMLNEEVGIAWGQQLPAEVTFSARLAIHDAEDGTHTQVVVSCGASVARLMAGRLLAVADPSPDDVLDAVNELGNIIGGNVKSLLRHACRLSLPTAEVSRLPSPTGVTGVSVQALVFGHLVELTVGASDSIDGLCWPGSMSDEILENQR